MEMTIAIDAMGGDFAPSHPVAGAVLAAREYGARLILVGRKEAIESELGKHRASDLPIEIVHASEVVEMHDSPVTAFRRKKDSSIRVAATLVRDGRATGVVSAGNTGAVMTTVKMICGVLEGVERPALCAVVPNLKGPSVWLDVGANIDVHVRVSPADRVVVSQPNRSDIQLPEVGEGIEVGWPVEAGVLFAENSARIHNS